MQLKINTNSLSLLKPLKSRISYTFNRTRLNEYIGKEGFYQIAIIKEDRIILIA